MTNIKATKRALGSSVLALFLCFAMLLGTTFAWFTDSVTSANNIITAGNLDVDLKYAKPTDVKDGNIGWKDVAEGALFNETTIWEPGHVEVVYLKVSNLGTLDLKYQLGVNVADFTIGKNAKGEDIDLREYLVFKVVEMPNDITTYEKGEDAIKAAGSEMGLKDYNGKTTALEVNGVDYVALIVYMPETVGNEANYREGVAPSITLGVNLFATQYTTEKDSFGPDYDAGIDLPLISTGAELKAALASGQSVKLNNDIEIAETIVIPAPAASTYSMRANDAVVIDLNGKTITGTMHKDDGAVIKNEGNLIIMNGTISSTANNGGSAIQNKGTLTVENVTLNGAPNAGGSWPSYTVNNTGNMTLNDCIVTSYHGAVASYNEGALVTMNNTDIDMKGIPGSTSHGIYTYSNGAVVVNSGNIVNHAADQGSTGGSVINGDVKVNGGTFTGRIENYYGTPVICGGTFSVKPNAKFIAPDSKVVNKDGKYVVVANDIDAVVSTPAELATAIVAGGKVFIATDIDMNNAWTSVVPTNGLTILGNGNTITNLNLPLLAGKAGPNVTIKGLTIANSNVGIAANENGLGSGAFMAWADCGGNLVFDDCHLLNSTVKGNERAAALIGYSIADVTIKNCSVDGSTIEAVGSTAGLIGHANGVTTIENSSVTNTKVTSTEDRTGKTALAGALVGTVNAATSLINVTSSNNAVSNNGANPVSVEIGRIVSGTLTIDGAVFVPNTDGLKGAIEAGATEVALGTGTYTLPTSAQGKNLTIVGNGRTTVDISDALNYNLHSSTVVFENITIECGTPGAGYDRGFAHATKVVFNNCVINGTLGLNCETEFKNCTFNVSGDYYSIWTWGATVATFNGCIFNSDGKAILLYGGVDTALTVNGCTFNDNGGLTDKKAAIEIGNDYGRSYTLTVNNTVVNGYEINDKGINTGSTLWGNKNSMGTDKLNVVIDGVDVY